MALWIQNITVQQDRNGLDKYAVRINHDKPLAIFYHDRGKGAAQCLRDAADAIDAALTGSAQG